MSEIKNIRAVSANAMRLPDNGKFVAQAADKTLSQILEMLLTKTVGGILYVFCVE